MKKFLNTLNKKLVFLEPNERKKVLMHYKQKYETFLAQGKTNSEILEEFGSIDNIVKKVCFKYNLNYNYCTKTNTFDKCVINFSKMIANFMRDIIKIFRKVKLKYSLEGFLEALVKVIALIFIFFIVKLPFLLTEELLIKVNKIFFYPYNDGFDLMLQLIFSLIYLVICVVITLKAFGSYQLKEKKIIDESELTKVDKEYNWLEIIVRVAIYLVILVPLFLMLLVLLGCLIVSLYLLFHKIPLIGLTIVFLGLMGLMLTLIKTIIGSLNNKIASHLFLLIGSLSLFIIGIFISVFNFSQFKYPDTLDKSFAKITTEDATIELDDDDTKVIISAGDYEIIEDQDLDDNIIRVEVSYYDDYVDIRYHQEYDSDLNYLVFNSKPDKNINYFKLFNNIITDLEKGYIFRYSDVKKFNVKIYANEYTKENLEYNK